MSKVFLTFADSRMHRSLERIQGQASEMGGYDEIICADERALDAGFVSQYTEHLRHGVRGFGYWCWKPQIIKQTLEKMNEGDILQYTDAGCHLNYRGRARLTEYFDLAAKAETGILAFQAVPSMDPRLALCRKFPDLSEYKWCKGDLLDYFAVRNNPAITHTQAIGAGIIFLRKSVQAITLIDEWLKVFHSNFSLINDAPSVSPNLDGFVEHRHDQSIFSILCKLRGIQCESAFEYWFPGERAGEADWEVLKEFPIHAKRDKGVSVLGKICMKLKRWMQVMGK
jgi:hypothetical protein